MTDQHKAFFLSVALGAFESVKNEELAGSVRHRRMVAAIKECCRTVDIYRPDAWGFREMNKASALLDEINERIKLMFPTAKRKLPVVRKKLVRYKRKRRGGKWR